MKIILAALLMLGVVTAPVTAQNYPSRRREPPPWNWALVGADGKAIIGYNGKPREGMDNVACEKISQSYPGSKCVQRD